MTGLARSEILLLARNRIAVFNAALLPVMVFGLFVNGGGDATLLIGVLGFVLLGVLYYTLVSTYVARREDLVLKRLRVGVLSDVEILAGTAGPAVAVALGQMVLFVAGGAIAFGLPVPANAPVLLAGILGGTVVFALIAALSSAFTRTVELAQVTTLPVLLVCLVGAGLTVPVDALPPAVAGTLRWLPLTPTLDLVRLGWLGRPGEGVLGVLRAAAGPAGLLAAWTVLGWVAVRRWFRWSPRR
ncbi:ABC transporter permease [Dactylosporangium sp. NPDC005555]|uniref:ABC transporter permease n=1 Tax=Dactylosporangium sp. NPDC005555 TaxID=3154889 RepID=UPI0033A38B39